MGNALLDAARKGKGKSEIYEKVGRPPRSPLLSGGKKRGGGGKEG